MNDMDKRALTAAGLADLEWQQQKEREGIGKIKAIKRLDQRMRQERGWGLGKDAPRHGELREYNYDKEPTPKQTCSIVAFADKRYRLNVVGLEKIITRKEAADICGVIFGTDGTRKGMRGVKKARIEHLYQKVEAWRKEEAARKEAAEEQAAIECLNGRLRMERVDSDLDRANPGLSIAIEEAFWNALGALNYTEANLEMKGKTLEAHFWELYEDPDIETDGIDPDLFARYYDPMIEQERTDHEAALSAQDADGAI